MGVRASVPYGARARTIQLYQVYLVIRLTVAMHLFASLLSEAVSSRAQVTGRFWGTGWLTDDQIEGGGRDAYART